MTPEAAVGRLAAIIASRAEFTTEDDVYAAMSAAGIPDAIADRTYKFTQIAWGRVFLDGLGVTFAPDYLCFNGAGDVVESGPLAEEPYFVAAMATAKEHAGCLGFTWLAMLSADVQAVNNGLNDGAKPENLVTAPSALFLEPATPAAIEKARTALTQRVAPARCRGGGSGSANG